MVHLLLQLLMLLMKMTRFLNKPPRHLTNAGLA